MIHRTSLFMKDFAKLLGCLFLAGLVASCASKYSQADYQVVPLPQHIASNEGEPFRLDANVVIIYPKGNEKMQRNAEFLAEYLKTATGKDFPVQTNAANGQSVISLELGLENANPESYRLRVTDKRISIQAPSEAGAFYGIQTLRKSLPVASHASAVLFSPVEINDQPRFAYRGAHLDICRHFFTVDEVKTYIDMLALHNMNYFHWHISDDQGWRIEIKKYPRLTEVGSKRTGTVIGRNSGQYDGQPYGGFYTQEQAREIVRYAAQRHITVVPEIDLPGHMQAALAAYPGLGCTGGPYEVWREWGISENVLCAGNDKTMQFITDVLGEIMEVFPSPYIHIGGDECPKTQWEKCPKCQAMIHRLGLRSDERHSKEQQLQSYLVQQVEKFVNSRGRQIIGWDEILEGGLDNNATVMCWRGEEWGIEAAKQSHDVIMVPSTHLYFDYYQAIDTEHEPLAIGGYIPLEKVYSYEPCPAGLTADQQQHVKGVQANLWTEYITTLSHAQYMVLPRWAALSEIQWTMPEKKDYDNFLKRLSHLADWYKVEGYHYAPHVFRAQVHCFPNPVDGTVDVTLGSIDGSPVHYTLDGTMPTASSPVYEDTLKIQSSCRLQAAIVKDEQDSLHITAEDIRFSKATARPLALNQPIHPRYQYGGVYTLVDGLHGNANYKTGRWLGFSGNDLDVTVNLQLLTPISGITLTTCVQKADWIFNVRALKVQVSSNGEDYTTVLSKQYPAMKEADKDGVYTQRLTFPSVKARYVRITATPENEIPDWHAGKGNHGFLFVDEIQIE